MTTPLADLTALAERYQAIAKRTPVKYRQEIQTIADLLDTAADFAHSILAERVLGRSYEDLGIDVPTSAPAPAPTVQPETVVYYNDLRRYGTVTNTVLLDYIKRTNGATIQQTMDRFGLAYGTAYSRLNTLRRRGFLAVHRIPSPNGGRRLLVYRLAHIPTPVLAPALQHAAQESLPDLPDDRAGVDDADIVAFVSQAQSSGTTVDEAAAALGLGKTTMYKRLRALTLAGLITSTGTRRVRYYMAEYTPEAVRA